MPQSILAQLKKASWRGIEFPYTGTRDYGFAQDQAQHRFIFRDQQLIESLGAQNPTLRYQIPFRENLRQYGWKNLFTVVYPKFLAACADRTSALLNDPLHGENRYKCVSFSESLSVDRTDGVDVTVDFIFAPEEDTDVSSQFAAVASTLQGLESSIVQYGQTVLTLSAEQKAYLKTLNTQNTVPEISALNAIRAAAGVVQQYKDRTRSYVAAASNQLEQTREDIMQAADPQLDLLRRDAGRLALGARQSNPGTNAGKLGTAAATIHSKVRANLAIGRLAFATANQVSVDDLIKLNPEFANMQVIPAGTIVYVPKKGK